MQPTSSTRVFDHYEAEYLSKTKTAAQSLERLADLIPGVEKDKVVKETEKALEAAEEIVQQMELEARSTQGETKAQLIAQVLCPSTAHVMVYSRVIKSCACTQAKDYKAGIALLRSKLKVCAQIHTTRHCVPNC
jgi:hypothetical protein